ncbi:hypothetical protein BLS_001502 [Venturia inaequalis]|uniref:Uncharacterized protein n=1 Tax=Venturia inaequalis TaxID=5025 RepID=A0A8H3YZ66_VENIN|nr:hypothetical protein BLS_001502 [Venturia inaequalis]RDI81766.1 hypothetical protein Vi05172_g8267 [Venturia inaequalis]
MLHLSRAYHCLNTPPPAPVVAAPVVSAPIVAAPVVTAQTAPTQTSVAAQSQSILQQSSARQADLQDINEQDTDEDQVDEEQFDEWSGEDEVNTQAEIDERSTVQDEQIDVTTADSDEGSDSMPVNRRKTTNSKADSEKRRIELSPRKNAPKHFKSTEDLKSGPEGLEDIKNRRIAMLDPEILAKIQALGLVLELDQTTTNAVKSWELSNEVSTRFAEVYGDFQVATEQVSSINKVHNEARRIWRNIKAHDTELERLERDGDPDSLRPGKYEERERLYEQVEFLFSSIPKGVMSGTMQMAHEKAADFEEFLENLVENE